MPFSETLAPFFADFGVAGTLAGAPVRGIFDAASIVEGFDGAVTQAPSYQLATPAAPVAVGAVLVIPAGTYTVRQALADEPDGATTRLVLARP